MSTATLTINKIKSKLAEVPEDKLSEIYDFIEFLLFKSKSKSVEVKKKSIGSTGREFGCGKGIFTYISEDFDAPLPEFSEYMK